MISRNKVQMDIFKAIIGDSGRLAAFDLGNGDIGITTDGYIVDIMQKDQIAFSLEKFNWVKNIEVFQESENDVVVTPTGRMFSNRYLTVELQGDGVKTYVDNKKLQRFDGCTFKVNSALSRVLAYDNFGLVGLFLPLRFEPKEDAE